MASSRIDNRPTLFSAVWTLFGLLHTWRGKPWICFCAKHRTPPLTLYAYDKNHIYANQAVKQSACKGFCEVAYGTLECEEGKGFHRPYPRASVINADGASQVIASVGSAFFPTRHNEMTARRGSGRRQKIRLFPIRVVFDCLNVQANLKLSGNSGHICRL
jgi:hypothetical protein